MTDARPKEWWIEFSGDPLRDKYPSFRKVSGTDFRLTLDPGSECIHVIEHAAYQALEAEISRVRAILAQFQHEPLKGTGCVTLTVQQFNVLVNERDKAQSDLTTLRAQLAEAKAEVERLKEELFDSVPCKGVRSIGSQITLERERDAAVAEARVLREGLEWIKDYHEKVKGDMHRRNINWMKANETLAKAAAKETK